MASDSDRLPSVGASQPEDFTINVVTLVVLLNFREHRGGFSNQSALRKKCVLPNEHILRVGSVGGCRGWISPEFPSGMVSACLRTHWVLR